MYEINKIQILCIIFFWRSFCVYITKDLQRKSIKSNKNLISCIIKGITKSSKKKQRIAFAKSIWKVTTICENINKDCKKLFKVIKRKSKNYYYSDLLIKYKDNIKSMANIKNKIFKDITVKSNLAQISLPCLLME